MTWLRAASCLVISLWLGCAAATPASPQSRASEEFVGSTPGDALSRAFLGGYATNAPCHCITWRLTLLPKENTYRLTATYGVPGRDDPNQLEVGPTVQREGRWDIVQGSRTSSKAVVYRLHGGGKHPSLSLVRVGEHLLHFLDEDKSLRVGNAGWSYTLSRKGVGRDN